MITQQLKQGDLVADEKSLTSHVVRESTYRTITMCKKRMTDARMIMARADHVLCQKCAARAVLRSL